MQRPKTSSRNKCAGRNCCLQELRICECDSVQKQHHHYPNRSKQAKYQLVIQQSHNVTTHRGLDAAAIQVELLPKYMGLHGIISIGQVHLHGIVPLIHRQTCRGRLQSLFPLCNIAALLQHVCNTHMHTCPQTHTWCLASHMFLFWACLRIHLSTFCWGRWTSAPFPASLLYGREAALGRPN